MLVSSLLGASACRGLLGIDELGAEDSQGVDGLGDGQGGSAASAAGEGGSMPGGAAGWTAGGPPVGGQAGRGENAGEGGTSGAGGAGGVSGEGGGPGCQIEDGAEPNDVPAQAKRLPDLNTCESGKSVAGVMDGGDDWYTFHAKRNYLGGFFCEKVEAWALTPSVLPLRVCYYMSPSEAVSCPQGTEFGNDSVPVGYAGCCSSNGASVTFAQNDAEVLLKVSAAAPVEACFAYTLSYNY